MKFPGTQGQWQGSLIFFLAILVLISLEFYGKIFERGVGSYLKWQNSARPQLGRIWERDRQTILAKSKIQSIRSVLDSRQESTEAIDSLKTLFESTQPTFPLVLSREKFLELYYDFPGQWSAQIISPFELISIDSKNNWTRVLLTRLGRWITIGFLDSQNIPVHEIFMATEALKEIQATRTVKQGKLEESGFKKDRVYSAAVFLPLLQTLDPVTRSVVFPDPRWFLAKNYSITRIGVRDPESKFGLTPSLEFGIEYDTDYYTGVLLIPVPQEIANNLLSQIERTSTDIWGEEFSSLTVPAGDNP